MSRFLSFALAFASASARRPGQVVLSLLTLACWFALPNIAWTAGSVENLDRDNGLPIAQLGAPLANFQGLVKTEDLGRFQTFKRPTDRLRYGKYEVTSITYNFFKDRLYSVVLVVAGKGNVRGIVKLLDQTYGKDHSNDSIPLAKSTITLDVREWGGSRAYCVMKSDSDETGGELRFIDKAVWDQLEAPRREKREVNKSMLKGSFINGDLDSRPAASPAPSQKPAVTLAPDQTPVPPQ